MSISSSLGILALLSTAVVSAQKGGAPIGTAPTTGTGGQPSVRATPDTGSPNAVKTPDVPRSIYLSGRVAMQDGSPVPTGVTIQRLCNGVSRTVAYTDSKGRFSFDWNDRNTVIGDASDPGSNRNTGGFGASQAAGVGAFGSDPFSSRIMNCELRANLAGYTSDLINLFNRKLLDNPDIGLIVLHRIAGVEGTSISATALIAPKDAKKAYEHGLQSLAKNKTGDAANDFEKAVALYPQYADAWVGLGRIRLQQHSIDAGRAALARAIECDPKLVTPYMELGILSARESKWKESGSYLDQALRLDPIDFPQAWYTDAVANYNLRNYDAAEKGAREALRLDPHHLNPRSDYLLGLILAEKQDYSGAAEELEKYLKLAPNAPDLAVVKEQLGKLEQLKGDGNTGQVPGPQR